MHKKNSLDWKTYEAITKYIYETLGKGFGVKVLGHGNNCKVLGKSGVNHQIDVLTQHSDGIHSYKTAIECKYWKEKVNKEIVMKVAQIIEDAGINKGIIVSKNGFTQDGIDFAKYKNIGLVELKESEEKGIEGTKKEIEFGYLETTLYITITRPQILGIKIEYLGENFNETGEVDIYNFTVKLSNGTLKPLTEYAGAFQRELHDQNKLFQTVTKRYELSGASLIDKRSNSIENIRGFVFSGMLIQTESTSNSKFTLVDEIWLIMKSIFDEKLFRITENGIIIEEKK